MGLFDKQDSGFWDYYRKWGAGIEQSEQRRRNLTLRQIENALQSDFDYAEACWPELERRFREMFFYPAGLLPKELDGFSVSGTGLLPKTILYFASVGVKERRGVRLPAGEVIAGGTVRAGEALLRGLCAAHPNLLTPGIRLARAPFFSYVGELSETVCGEFWKAVMEAERIRRVWETEQYGDYERDAISYDLEYGLDDLLKIRDVLRGDGTDCDHDAEVQRLLTAFERHMDRTLA